jgi:hypothetical protein
MIAGDPGKNLPDCTSLVWAAATETCDDPIAIRRHPNTPLDETIHQERSIMLIMAVLVVTMGTQWPMLLLPGQRLTAVTHTFEG